MKAPSQSNNQQTEVILPEQDQQKTLVYVLVKRPDASGADVKIRAPQPTAPAKPEVFFIRYKNNGGGGGGNGNGNGGGSGSGSSGSGSGGDGEYGVPNGGGGGSQGGY